MDEYPLVRVEVDVTGLEGGLQLTLEFEDFLVP